MLERGYERWEPRLSLISLFFLAYIWGWIGCRATMGPEDQYQHIRGEAPYLDILSPMSLGPNNFQFTAILRGEIRRPEEFVCAWIDWDFGDRGWNDGQGAIQQKPSRRVVTQCGETDIHREYQGWHWYRVTPGLGKRYEVHAILRSWRTHRELARVKMTRTLYLVD